MDEVERTIELPTNAAEAWRAVSEPEELEVWFADEVRLDVRPGGRGRFGFVDDDDRDALVLEVEPGRALTFSWWPVGRSDRTIVTIVVEPRGDDASRVRVRETRASTLRGRASTTWTSRLGALEARGALLLRA